MARYFVLDWSTPTHLERHTLEVGAAARNVRWHSGKYFSPGDEDEDFRPPPTPIELTTARKSGPEKHVYPEYTSQPLPLMSRRLVAALREAGANSLQSFDTRLVNPSGGASPDLYLAVNVIGHLKAASLKPLLSEPDLEKRLASLGELVAQALVFRVDVTEIVVHESVKAHVIGLGIDSLYWHAPPWAEPTRKRRLKGKG